MHFVNAFKTFRPKCVFLNLKILYDPLEILVMNRVVHTAPERRLHPPGLRYQSLPAGGAHRMCAHSSLRDHTCDNSQKSNTRIISRQNDILKLFLCLIQIQTTAFMYHTPYKPIRKDLFTETNKSVMACCWSDDDGLVKLSVASYKQSMALYFVP